MNSQRIPLLPRTLLVALILISGCRHTATLGNKLTLATTTSTQDSGLLDVLIPKFKEQTGIDVQVVAVGSGQTLEIGRRGDADTLLTHAPAAEQKFMDEGWGQDRRPVMSNDFILVGPMSDPAATKGLTPITAAFSRIADQAVPFVSRDDESGTHQKEKEVWKNSGREPQGDWYIHAGAGMAEVLRMAHEKQAYTLADRGTFLASRKDLELEILSERDSLLQNNYTVIITNKHKHPHVNAEAAQQFVDFLTSSSTKELIATFGVDKLGESLFYPQQ